MNFLDTLREAETSHNQIIIGIGNAWTNGLHYQTKSIDKAVKDIARRHDVDYPYLKFFLLSPAGQRRLLSRYRNLKDLWVLISIWQKYGMPDVGRLKIPPEGGHDPYFKAIEAVDDWAKTTLYASVGKALKTVIGSKVRDMRRIKEEAYGRSFSDHALKDYMLLRLGEAIKKRPQWFLEAPMLRLLWDGWSRKG